MIENIDKALNHCQVFASAFASLAFAAALQPMAWADEPTVQRTTTVGHEVLVRTHQNFSENCQPRILPRVAVIRPPEHGHLDVREGDFVNTGTVVSNVHCEGTKLPGVLIYYVPDPGFEGTDDFTWDRRVNGVPNVRFNAHVTVAPAAGAEPAASQAR